MSACKARTRSGRPIRRYVLISIRASRPREELAPLVEPRSVRRDHHREEVRKREALGYHHLTAAACSPSSFEQSGSMPCQQEPLHGIGDAGDGPKEARCKRRHSHLWPHAVSRCRPVC